MKKGIVKVITIKTVNSPTILQRILQIIKRRRINIRRFTAQEKDKDHGFVKVEVEAQADQVKLLAAQIEKQVDVTSVKST
jgi:acetolactate synthase regulatory subunit